MRKAIDLKSAVIGGLLALVVLGCLGALPWLSQDHFGRFTIVESADGGAYILDTTTGQAWARNHSSSPGFFEPKLDLEAYRRAR
jgi:hypothetical protein